MLTRGTRRGLLPGRHGSRELVGDRLEAELEAKPVEFVDLAALGRRYASGEVLHVVGFGAGGGVVGHVNTAVVVADHESTEQLVGLRALGCPKRLHVLCTGHAGHLLGGVGRVHPRHRGSGRIGSRRQAPLCEHAPHLPDLDGLVAGDLARDLAKHRIRPVLEVAVTELEGLEVVGLHVLEEAHVDAAASGVVRPGDSPADDARDQTQRDHERERLWPRGWPREPAAHAGRLVVWLGRGAGSFDGVELGRHGENKPVRKPDCTSSRGSGQESTREVHVWRGTLGGSAPTIGVVECADARSALSALVDGEDPGVVPRLVAAHVDGCASCRAFAQDAARLGERLRVHSVEQIPDLRLPILLAIGQEARSAKHDARLRAWRLVLMIAAAMQVGIALPALVFGADAGLPVHVARHLGSFDVAIAVGFMYAAWKPARVGGLLPVLATLAACLVATSAFDVLRGNTAVLSESHHAIDLFGVVAVWMLSRTDALSASLAA